MADANAAEMVVRTRGGGVGRASGPKKSFWITLRQAANGKMKLLLSVFSCLYSRVKIFVFAVNSRRHVSFFVWFIITRKEKRISGNPFAVCRLPYYPRVKVVKQVRLVK